MPQALRSSVEEREYTVQAANAVADFPKVLSS